MTSLSEALRQFTGRGLGNVSLPDLGLVESAGNRVIQKWPYVTVRTTETDCHKVAAELRNRIEKNDWAKVRVTDVVGYARVLFGQNCRNSHEVKPLHDFLLKELQLTDQSSLVNGMADVFYENYCVDVPSIKRFGDVLLERRSLLNSRWSLALNSFPSVFKVGQAHIEIAEAMVRMSLPHEELPHLGIVTPFEGGLMEHAHQVFIEKIRPQLSTRDGMEKIFNWIRPAPGVVRQAGAVSIVTALLSHWTAREPDTVIKKLITENLIATYRDPRVDRGFWVGVDKPLMDVFFRWLTGADMHFFTNVVDKTAFEGKHMWPPRRDFWLNLFENKKIDQAWVAFSDGARREAISMMQVRSQTDTRFGRQNSGSYTSTSLLIMKIGNKIVVDGCHSYKTQIFNEDDLGAPHFPWDDNASYDNRRMLYDAYEIRTRSKASYRHHPIDSWKRSVLTALRQNVPYTAEHERIKRQREQTAARNAAAAVNRPVEPTQVTTPIPAPTTRPVQTAAPAAPPRQPQAVPAPQVAAVNPTTRPSSTQATTSPKRTISGTSSETLFVHLPIDFTKLSEECNVMVGILQRSKGMTEDLHEAINYLRTKRPLTTIQRQKLQEAIDAVATDQVPFINIRKIVIPIFNRPMSQTEAQIWKTKADYLLSIARARNILSETSQQGFIKLRQGQELSSSERNAVEFALQQMRNGGVALATELKRAST
jgi:hypothetical protein